MIDFISCVFLTIIVALWLNKMFLGFGAERNFRKAFKELQENLDKYQQKSNLSNWEKKEKQDGTLEVKKLVETRDDFLHLNEKYKHSLNQRRKICNDWLTYTQVSLRMRSYDRDFMMLSDEKLLAAAGEKRYADKIKADEIEKRFKKLLKAI